ncbi:unnamed protein product, partial [Mesorhabditis spiculigera]
MRALIFCTLAVVVLVHGRPASSEDALRTIMDNAAKFDITDTIPQKLLRNKLNSEEFSPDLQEFAKSLDLVDVAGFMMLYGKRATFDTLDEVPGIMKQISPNTYKKVKKLMAACQLRFEELTPAAQRLFTEHGRDGLDGINAYNRLTEKAREEKLGNFIDAFHELSDEDQESIREQFPGVYKFNTDLRFIKKFAAEMDRQMAKQIRELRGELAILEAS